MENGNDYENGERTGSYSFFGRLKKLNNRVLKVCDGDDGRVYFCSLMLPIFAGDKWEAKQNNAKK